MKTYEQTVTFKKKIKVKARNAEHADQLLDEKVSAIEFAGEVDVDIYHPFDDDSVVCPVCKGSCYDPDDVDEENPRDCKRCEGNGEIWPEEYHDDESLYK